MEIPETGRVSKAARIEQALAETSFLPPAFEMIPRLLLLLDEAESNSESLAELIRLDAGLTTDVLHIANSASYSGAVRTETLSQAILRIGLREIYRVVMTIIASPMLSAVDQPSFAKLELWRHSIGAAVAAQIIARDKGLNEEIAFTAGLLHDVGKLALGQTLGQEYIDAIEECNRARTGFSEAEKTLFGADHAEIGGKLLRRWNFPDQIVSAVAFHHDPKRAPKEHARLTAVIYAGNILAYRIEAGYGRPAYATQPDQAALRLVPLKPDELAAYNEQVALWTNREQARFR